MQATVTYFYYIHFFYNCIVFDTLGPMILRLVVDAFKNVGNDVHKNRFQ